MSSRNTWLTGRNAWLAHSGSLHTRSWCSRDVDELLGKPFATHWQDANPSCSRQM
jgi:hypothetical protein